jgi:hypothetical protein
VLYRHLGIDPDVTRTPVEELVVERLLKGGFSAQRLPEDALALIAVQAPGVDDIYVEEALWTAVDAVHTIDAPS